MPAPAENGTTRRIGLVGQVWAPAVRGRASAAVAAAIIERRENGRVIGMSSRPPGGSMSNESARRYSASSTHWIKPSRTQSFMNCMV